jgi:ribosome biogenesis GTPase A
MSSSFLNLSRNLSCIMSRSFWDAVNGVIREADILLEVVDARLIEETRNKEIEDKVRRMGKLLIFVFNKCDLADQQALEHKKKELTPSVFVSCKEYFGIGMLRERIMIEAKRLGKDRPIVGVLGYPNMGKSSIINALNGTGRVRTSAESGFTHGKQYVVIGNMKLIDTPGVIPYGEKDDIKNLIAGIKTDLKDPESDILRIMVEFPGMIEGHYGVEVDEDHEVTLENIAKKLSYLLKGNKPDTFKAAKHIAQDLRQGKIKI